MLLIFDLDGTLIDSKKDLAISTNAVRAKFGMEPLPEDLIGSFVGNGAPALVRRAMGPGTPEPVIEDALKQFLAIYRAHALEHTRLYPGIREALTQLAASSNRLGVLTNKPGRISTDILAALGLSTVFLRVYGGDTLPAKKPDPLGIFTLIKDAASHPAETLMIGDSSVDVQTARRAGVRSCGVLWGFQPDSFREFPPDLTVAQPDELPAAVSRLQTQ